MQEFKLAFSEFYLSLILLQNYQNLNHTGFRKILKKHDKLLRVDIGGNWQKEKVEASHFFTNRDIDKIINETETVVTTELESGDRQRAMKRLRVPPLGEFKNILKFLLLNLRLNRGTTIAVDDLQGWFVFGQFSRPFRGCDTFCDLLL